MAMNGGASGAGRRQRHRVMAEINVTPMVDVMLVLLIVFMVSAPLLTVGVPIELPKTQAKSVDQDNDPLNITINAKGGIFLQTTEISADDMVDKVKAIIEARGGDSKTERINVSADKGVDYGTVAGVLAKLSKAGLGRLMLRTDVERSS